MAIFMRGTSYYLKFADRGKQYLRSLQTTDLKKAKERGKQIRKAIISGKWQEADALRVHSDYCTIGTIIETYQAAHATLQIRPRTLADNVGSFRNLIRDGKGLPRTASVDAMRSTELTGDLVRNFQTMRQNAITTQGALSKGKGSISINSIYRQAKSLFGRRAMQLYRKLKMPDLTEFKSVPNLNEPDTAYSPIPAEQIASMHAAAVKLKTENPALYLVHQLFLRCGLRNSEMLAARWSWLETHDNQQYLGIKLREDYEPKARERYVALPADMIEFAKALQKDDYIVPAKSSGARKQLIYRDHSKWVREFLPADRTKSSYELRRHAGSVIATRDGSLFAAQTFLGHSTPSTTAKYYARLLKPVAPITAEEVGG